MPNFLEIPFLKGCILVIVPPMKCSSSSFYHYKWSLFIGINLLQFSANMATMIFTNFLIPLIRHREDVLLMDRVFRGEASQSRAYFDKWACGYGAFILSGVDNSIVGISLFRLPVEHRVVWF